MICYSNSSTIAAIISVTLYHTTQNLVQNEHFPKQALVFTCLQYKSFDIAPKEQFLLYPQYFLPIWRTFYHFHQIQNCRLQILTLWKSLKFIVWARVKVFCKLKMIQKMNCLWWVRKRFREGRKCWFLAFSPFPTMFSKGLCHQVV